MTEHRPFRVLFVCLGNICRSPTADGVFRKLVASEGLEKKIECESAGISDYHEGDPADARAVAAAKRRNIDISGLRSRPVSLEDFLVFDLMLAMDQYVLDRLITLRRSMASSARTETRLFLDFAPELAVREVPDPYEGGDAGFEYVLDLIEAGTRGLLADIKKRLAG